MTRCEVENELDKLYRDLEFAHNADENTVCRSFNTDSKSEYIKLITDEIDFYESALEEFNIPDDDGMDYDALCRVQGLARYALLPYPVDGLNGNRLRESGRVLLDLVFDMMDILAYR